MSAIRQPAVSGLFYPEDPQQLKEDVDLLMAQVRCPPDAPVPKVVIVPHAGYVYSGSVAAKAYARVMGGSRRINRVILLGPSHRVGFHGVAITHASAYRTPLGDVPLDEVLAQQLLEQGWVRELDSAHGFEHSLEVQLPFLQRCLKSFRLLPLVVGQANPDALAELLDFVWGGRETLIVISTDLSHYLDYQAARQRDHATVKQICCLHPEAITSEDACGAAPLRGLLQLLKKKGLKPQLLDLRNSGDTAGDKERVVGYAACQVLA